MSSPLVSLETWFHFPWRIRGQPGATDAVKTWPYRCFQREGIELLEAL
jgi:hypothetical protein